MYERHYWQRRIRRAWDRRNVVWLMGVRRVGKTVLCQSLPEVEYFDCELPRTRRRMEDPEGFLEGLGEQAVVLDEIHRLQRPSELLKIAADHFPTVRVLATGSSSLSASARFGDTLAGRKEEVWLAPMITPDLADFGRGDLEHRLLRGGLPEFFLAAEPPEREYQEWMDAFWARDVLELFRLERRQSFLRFVELLMTHSGGIFEATRYARPCEVSRPTISNYLAVLEATFVAHVIRPFARRRSAEIISAPKVYGFDTGFVCFFRGWDELRREDLGLVWEHLVLNELLARLKPGARVQYWRTKHGNEIDFVLTGRGQPPIAIECKWSGEDVDSRNLRVFRRHYPDGANFLVAADAASAVRREISGIPVHMLGLGELIEELEAPP